MRLSTWTDNGNKSLDTARPPSAAPSRTATFSIDFAMPASDEPDDSLGTLCRIHEQAIDSVLPPEDDERQGVDSWNSGSSLVSPPASSSPSSSGPASRPPPASVDMVSLDGKPQFNLASAESLLCDFRSMLVHFPCIVLGADEGVKHLAAARPFVLLAILATTSGSRSLRGHDLYDAEYRKVLGLKFVAGADIVRDLELDSALLPRDASDSQAEGITRRQLDGVRAYTGHCHISAALTSGWRKYTHLAASFTPWTMTCCDILEDASGKNGTETDLVLAILVRQSSIAVEASIAIHDGRPEHQQTRHLVLMGLETQACELDGDLPVNIAGEVPIRLGSLFVESYIQGGAILSSTATALQTPPRLSSCVTPLSRLLSEVSSLPPSTFPRLTVAGWAYVVMGIVMAFRLSLPPSPVALPCDSGSCFPFFDHRRARKELGLAEFLHAMTTGSGDHDGNDNVLSATRVILKVVKAKFDRRVQAADVQDAAAAPAAVPSTCPMLDGSLDSYLGLWDPLLTMPSIMPSTMPSDHHAFASASGTSSSGKDGGSKQAVFHDIWATMTMGWTRDNAM
ncbi:hypothetical protein GMORB2_5216 [Geosmithia morbida]|uniref:Uncharacterized protein n=1 Tax=Geosmithia morbida TaxID=1094350 RepID=A0A9P5D6A2_9HYPO|nr:uncharacterized protein GMORB2_5216 [Geosmithia morbida]KAF4124550.1 hypothetical protein GMORB2_5216 [Geosmithia morbida]